MPDVYAIAISESIDKRNGKEKLESNNKLFRLNLTRRDINIHPTASVAQNDNKTDRTSLANKNRQGVESLSLSDSLKLTKKCNWKESAEEKKTVQGGSKNVTFSQTLDHSSVLMQFMVFREQFLDDSDSDKNEKDSVWLKMVKEEEGESE